MTWAERRAVLKAAQTSSGDEAGRAEHVLDVVGLGRLVMTESDREQLARARQIIEELAAILRHLSDAEVRELLGQGALDDLLKAILDPAAALSYSTIADFLLANKWRATLLALVRHAITHNYSFKGSAEGVRGFVSPHYVQWFDDGVMFLEGEEPFTGSMGLYRNGKVSYAVAARDIQAGEALGPEDFKFVDIDELSGEQDEATPE